MATWTRAELADRILRHLGVIATAQSASADDSALVVEMIDAAYDRLSKAPGLPFNADAIPTWAQIPLRDYVAVDVKPTFGHVVQRLPNGDSPEQKQAERELYRQLAGRKHKRRVKALYY